MSDSGPSSRVVVLLVLVNAEDSGECGIVRAMEPVSHCIRAVNG